MNVAVGQNASVLAALPSESSTSIASYTNGVLEVNAIGGVKVLSFNTVTSGFSGEEFTVQGSHYCDLAFSVSPSEEYVFFCESKSELASTCSPFIYDVLGDMIYPLQLEGQPVDLLVTRTASVLWTNQGISLDNSHSINQLQPWLLSK